MAVSHAGGYDSFRFAINRFSKRIPKKGAPEMAKDPNSHETFTSPEPQQAQTQLRIDDTTTTVNYSSTARIWGSAEEIIIDFSQGVRPSSQQNVAVLKIDTRVIMSPWAAKRLAIALGQTIARYEATYGPIETDPRKRLTPEAAKAVASNTTTTT